MAVWGRQVSAQCHDWSFTYPFVAKLLHRSVCFELSSPKKVTLGFVLILIDEFESSYLVCIYWTICGFFQIFLFTWIVSWKRKRNEKKWRRERWSYVKSLAGVTLNHWHVRFWLRFRLKGLVNSCTSSELNVKIINIAFGFTFAYFMITSVALHSIIVRITAWESFIIFHDFCLSVLAAYC